MPVTYDEAIFRFLQICEQHEGFDRVERACLVRDLEGRLRLVVRLEPGEEQLDPSALTTTLKEDLGKWFAGPVLSTRAEDAEVARLANTLFDKAGEWPDGWPQEWSHPVTGRRYEVSTERWCALARTLSKHAWLDGQRVSPPWPLVRGAPAVVSFYSFKGGVGRSTLLALSAWHLARQGARVVVLDLDLEAPGQAALLGARPAVGVLDYILSYCATDDGSVDDLFAEATSLPNDVEGRIDVCGAGDLSWSFVEKLARLDYSSGGLGGDAESPVADALRALLLGIKRRVEPEYIFIDARSGLHDLGGLSIHGLSHVDVFVARATQQNRQGLELALEAFSRRISPEERRPFVIHNFAPMPTDGEVSLVEQLRFREWLYEVFESTIYREEEDVPQMEDDTASHFPGVVPAYSEMESVDELGSIEEAVAKAEPFRKITQRIKELCERESAGDDDEEGDAEAVGSEDGEQNG